MSSNTSVNPFPDSMQPGAEAEPVRLVTPQAPPDRRLRIYSHSTFFFWWPVWAVGYVMALITYFNGRTQQIEEIGRVREWIHPSSNLGVVYFLVLFMVILITNLSARGLASGMVIMGGALVTVVLAFLGWWDEIFTWFGDLPIHLTLGAYFWFSTLMFVSWLVVLLGPDRATYWDVTPGQVTHKSLFGAGSKSYNTQGMGLEKHRDDLFRHWLLGLGSGDLRILTSGATRERIDIVNVLFIGWKVEAMQRLIAAVPETAAVESAAGISGPVMVPIEREIS